MPLPLSEQVCQPERGFLPSIPPDCPECLGRQVFLDFPKRMGRARYLAFGGVGLKGRMVFG